MAEKTKLLFVAENITLAQVVRLVTLAQGLDTNRYEIHFACSHFAPLVFAGTPFVQHRLDTIEASTASRAVSRGRRLYDEATLERYIRAECALIDRVKPRVVVGDFRLSLPTSAELCGVPSAVLINAYWSPYGLSRRFPVPDHPILGWLGEGLTQAFFPLARPWAFARFAAPINAVRRKNGLAPTGGLLEVLTAASHTLYPDDPAMFPVEDLPDNHHFLGPVLWEPKALASEQISALARDRPVVYATLGSSGELAALPMVVEALGRMDVSALVATAGRGVVDVCPDNVRVAEFWPGGQLCAAADLVLSNGGSTTGYQALAAGTPVVGIPSNLDQYLASEAIERSGAGLLLKARQASVAGIVDRISRGLQDKSLRQRAQAVQSSFASLNASERFAEWLRSVVG